MIPDRVFPSMGLSIGNRVQMRGPFGFRGTSMLKGPGKTLSIINQTPDATTFNIHIKTQNIIKTKMAKRAGENEHVWENIGSHIWEAVQEDDDGNLVTNSVTSLAEAIRKRRKLLSSRDYAQSSRRIIRDMIRYLYIVIDTSQSSREKDLALSPSRTRLDVVLKNTLDFIGEYYDQNPLSHLGIILLRDGEAEMLTELSGSPRTHKFALEALIRSESGTGPTTGEYDVMIITYTTHNE